MTCSLNDCDKKVFSRGWCQMHDARWLRHGDPLVTLAPGRESGRRTRGGPVMTTFIVVMGLIAIIGGFLVRSIARMDFEEEQRGRG